MQATTFERTAFGQTAAVSLVTSAALVLLGLVLAYWTWAWFAPRPEPRAPAAVPAGGPAAGAAKAAHGLFGLPGARNGAAPAATDVKLLGVVAASGGRSGYAVLRLNARQSVSVQEGGEIQPGLRLAEVHAESVVLERNGLRQTIELPTRDAPAAGSAPVSNK